MKVSIKRFNVTMALGSDGITLDVYDTADKFIGDLRIGKATIEWCAGRTRAGNGVKKGWPELIEWFTKK